MVSSHEAPQATGSHQCGEPWSYCEHSDHLSVDIGDIVDWHSIRYQGDLQA